MELSSDFLAVSALSGADRTTSASAQLERAARCCRAPDSGTHACCGSAMVLVLVSSASGSCVSGCTREFGDSRPRRGSDRCPPVACIAQYAVRVWLCAQLQGVNECGVSGVGGCEAGGGEVVAHTFTGSCTMMMSSHDQR